MVYYIVMIFFPLVGKYISVYVLSIIDRSNLHEKDKEDRLFYYQSITITNGNNKLHVLFLKSNDLKLNFSQQTIVRPSALTATMKIYFILLYTLYQIHVHVIFHD